MNLFICKSIVVKYESLFKDRGKPPSKKLLLKFIIAIFQAIEFEKSLSSGPLSLLN